MKNQAGPVNPLLPPSPSLRLPFAITCHSRRGAATAPLPLAPSISAHTCTSLPEACTGFQSYSPAQMTYSKGHKIMSREQLLTTDSLELGRIP